MRLRRAVKGNGWHSSDTENAGSQGVYRGAVPWPDFKTGNAAQIRKGRAVGSQNLIFGGAAQAYCYNSVTMT